MSSCYFAHAVFGIPLGRDEEHEAERLRQDANLSYHPDEVDEILSHVNKSDFASQLRKKYRAPDATIFLVDEEDRHPGRSHTAPGTWLLGYGLGDFPRSVDEEAFGGQGSWHTWVTASC